MKNHSLHREGIVGWLFVMPSILGFLAFVLIPVLVSVFISFTSWDIVSGLSNIQFIGISNFKQLFEDSMFIKSLQNNLVYTVLFVPSTMILALLIALAMNQKIYGRNMLRALFFIPFITNIVAISIVWMALFHPYSGPINKLLEALGMQNPPMWLMKRSSALPSITVVNVWFHMGYAMVIFLNGLQTVPRDLYEAADIDGAGPVRKFFRITLPMLSPTTFFILVTTMIDSFKVFGTINVMTQGGPSGDATTVIVFYMYQTAFRYYRMGYASAMSLVLFLMIFIVTIVQWRGQKKWVGYSL